MKKKILLLSLNLVVFIVVALALNPRLVLILDVGADPMAAATRPENHLTNFSKIIWVPELL